MRVSDYRRMSKISLKSRKKSTKNTVRGICFGLILLIPIVFFTLSFFMGLTGTINETPTISSFTLPGKNVYDTSGKSTKRSVQINNGSYTYVEYEGLGALDAKTLNALSTQDGMDERVVAEYYVLGIERGGNSGNPKIDITLGGESKKTDGMKVIENNYESFNAHKIKAVNLDESSVIITREEKAELARRNKSAFIAGGEFTASEKGLGEMIISETFLSNVGFSKEASQYLGKTISVTYNYGRGEDARYFDSPYVLYENNKMFDYSTPAFFEIIKNFKVVGILSKDYFNMSSTVGDSHLWVSTASIYDENNTAIMGEVSLESVEDENQSPRVRVDYDNIKESAKTAAEEKRMFVALGALGYTSSASRNENIRGKLTDADILKYCPQDIKVQAKSYEAATKMGGRINAEYQNINPYYSAMNTALSTFATAEYGSFAMLNTIGNYLMLVLYAFGGIIFFATLLNLYNTINYSVQVRKNYIGVMRAIGAKQNVIPKIYFFEIVQIFLKAMPWVIIFAGGISYAIKWGIDSMFKMMSTMLSVAIELNFMYFFITLAGVALLVFGIAFMFSQIACWNAARRPILEVLSDDKG